jgi:ubiquinone biosynthesis protein UbiJ
MLLARLVGAQSERISVLERHIAPPPERLVPLLSTAAALEEAVVPLLRRYDMLRRYLRRPEVRALAAQLRGPGTIVAAQVAGQLAGQVAGQVADRTPEKIVELKVQIQKEIVERADQLRTKILTIIGSLELLPGGLVRLGLESTMPVSVEAGAHCDELLHEMSNLERQWADPAAEEPASPSPPLSAASRTASLVDALEQSLQSA